MYESKEQGEYYNALTHPGKKASGELLVETGWWLGRTEGMR